MTEEPKRVHRYGRNTLELPTADSLRKTDCLCLNCDRLKPGSPNNCPHAQALYEICKEIAGATFITRCSFWLPNTSRNGSE